MSVRARITALAVRWEAGVLGRAVRRFIADEMTDRAAALSYYALLSLIPSLLIVAAALRLLGDQAVVAEIEALARAAGASSSLATALGDVLGAALESAPIGAGALGLIGLGTLVYGASRGFSAAGRALDRIRRRRHVPRPLLRRVEDACWALVLIVLTLALVVGAFATGELVRHVFEAVGLEATGTALWDLLRWPAVGVLMLSVVSLVMWAAPSGPRPPVRRPSAGALVAAAIWLVASVGYAVYLASFARYNATYGAFAGLVILTFWVWMTAMAFLFGAELDAVLCEDADAAEAPGRAPR